MHSRASWIAITVVLLLGLASADNKKSDATTSGPTPITQSERFDIIRALNGELVFIRKPFPMGTKGIVITPDGRMIPDGADLQQAVQVNGPAAMPGDRARITNMIIKKNVIIFEINGGPMRKKKWYDHLEVGGMGGMTPVSQQSNELRKGSFVVLQFDKFVPQVTPEQLKQRLAGVLDFNATNSLQAYLETIPPKAKQAIKEHRVLVGMNRQMVIYSLGQPGKKIREKDSNNVPYEEWIYGDPPQEVKFVRFVGDEVTRLEIMQVDGQKIVRTAKEIDIQPATQEASAKAQPEQPANAPTLRRPGEKTEDMTKGPAPGHETQPTGESLPNGGDPGDPRMGPPMGPAPTGPQYPGPQGPGQQGPGAQGPFPR